MTKARNHIAAKPATIAEPAYTAAQIAAARQLIDARAAVAAAGFVGYSHRPEELHDVEELIKILTR
jgi:hypothetical protein